MSARATKDSIAMHTVSCVAALALVSIFGWVANGSVYRPIALYCSFAPDASTLFTAALFGVLVAVVRRRPSLLDRRSMGLIAVGCLASAAVILPLAMRLQSAPFSLVGIALLDVGAVWPLVLTLLSAVSLPPRRVAASIAAALALSAIVQSVLPVPDPAGGAALIAAAQTAAMILSWRSTSKAVDRITRGAPSSNLELETPRAFLGPIHPLFFCLFLFNAASAFASTFSEGTQASSSFGWIVPVLAFGWMVVGSSRRREDHLFSAAVLLVLGGFLALPFSSTDGVPLAVVLLGGGSACFRLLFWVTIVAIGTRNVYAFLPVLGVGSIMNSLGVEVGATLGHFAASTVGTDMTGIVAAVSLFVFMSFLWLFFRSFSFSDTIQGVEPVEPVRAADSGAAIDARCRRLAFERGLTEREQEIFTMMAKGRNTRFVQEELVISQNTAKSHIKHIYQKLGVHSQQELIDLVERMEAESRR